MGTVTFRGMSHLSVTGGTGAFAMACGECTEEMVASRRGRFTYYLERSVPTHLVHGGVTPPRLVWVLGEAARVSGGRIGAFLVTIPWGKWPEGSRTESEEW